MASLDKETATKILRQVEFYFSDSNLPQDDFLRETVSQSKDGMVSLALICSFSRIRAYLGLGQIKRHEIPHKVLKSVAQILRQSDFLKVSDDGTKVGRAKELLKPEEVIEQVDMRSIAASPFEYDVKAEDVESFFAKFGKVNSLRLPRHAIDKKVFCGTALIEFSTKGDTEKVLKQNLVYAGAHLELKPKKEFDSERAQMMEQIGKLPSTKGSNDENNSSTTCNYPKDLIIAFTLKSIRRPGENRGNAEPIADDGCKEHAVKRIENASEELIETPVKNSEKEKCEKIEESEHKVSRDIRSSEKMPVKFTKENHIIAEESNKKLTGKKGNATFVDNKKYVISCEDLKDVFQRFGAVKLVDYSEGAGSGYIQFEGPEATIKVRAAAEFIKGVLIVKNFVVSLHAVTGRQQTLETFYLVRLKRSIGLCFMVTSKDASKIELEVIEEGIAEFNRGGRHYKTKVEVPALEKMILKPNDSTKSLKGQNCFNNMPKIVEKDLSSDYIPDLEEDA